MYLRSAERADLPAFPRWLSDADVLRNLAMFSPLNQAAEEGWFDRMLAAQGKTDYHFVICLVADGRPIGTIGLHGIDFQHGTAESGIAIGEKSEWNLGNGTGALRAIWDYGFGEPRLERIGLLVNAGMTPDGGAYEKAGFSTNARCGVLTSFVVSIATCMS